MRRGTWLAGLVGGFAIGMAAGRSRRLLSIFPLSSIFPDFQAPDVARLVTAPQSVGGFTVHGIDGSNQPNDREIDIQTPGLVDGTVAVIFYRTTHTGNGSFHVRVNVMQTTEHTYSDSDRGPFSWQETIPAGVLISENKAPGSNQLFFAVSSDSTGNVTFSDVAILYKSNKLTVRVPPVAQQ